VQAEARGRAAGAQKVGESAGGERLASISRGSTAAEKVGGTLDDAHAKSAALLAGTLALAERCWVWS